MSASWLWCDGTRLENSAQCEGARPVSQAILTYQAAGPLPGCWTHMTPMWSAAAPPLQFPNPARRISVAGVRTWVPQAGRAVSMIFFSPLAPRWALLLGDPLSSSDFDLSAPAHLKTCSCLGRSSNLKLTSSNGHSSCHVSIQAGISAKPSDAAAQAGDPASPVRHFYLVGHISCSSCLCHQQVGDLRPLFSHT